MAKQLVLLGSPECGIATAAASSVLRILLMAPHNVITYLERMSLNLHSPTRVHSAPPQASRSLLMLVLVVTTHCPTPPSRTILARFSFITFRARRYLRSCCLSKSRLASRLASLERQIRVCCHWRMQKEPSAELPVQEAFQPLRNRRPAKERRVSPDSKLTATTRG